MKRILLTGSGTGGHIYPLIAIAREIKKIVVELGEEVDLKYFGPKDVFSFYLIGEGIAIHRITASKVRRYFSLLNILDLPRFVWSIFQALFKVFWFMPNVAFSKGGPASVPVIWACHFFKIPIIIHESDSIPGLSNQITSRYAKIIELGFANAEAYFKDKTKANIKVVGNPVKQELLEWIEPELAKSSFYLDQQKKTILVLGGSQGSQRINNFIFDNLEVLLEKYQIIHQVGTANYSDYKLKIQDSRFKIQDYVIVAYLENDLKEAYAAADLVICRAGAQTIFELAALGKPSILIPLPESAQNHQTENANQYAQTGAAIVVEEGNLLINIVLDQINKILDNEETKKKVSLAANNFYRPKAAKLIAQDILTRL